MNRCKLFARLTKSEDSTLFERILDEFFEEYSFLYGALVQNGLVDSVDMRHVESGSALLKIQVVLTKDVVTDFFIESVKKFLEEKLPSSCEIEVVKETSDTALITFRKGL